MPVSRPANPEELRASRSQESDRLKADLGRSDVENNALIEHCSQEPPNSQLRADHGKRDTMGQFANSMGILQWFAVSRRRPRQRLT